MAPRIITRYVSIGHPGNNESPKQILNNRVMVNVDLDATTPTRVAKAFRKDICDTFKQLSITKPSELWWAIYESVDAGYPTLWSENTPLEVTLGKKEPQLSTFRKSGKSLLGTELVEKGFASQPQTSKIGGYQAKLISIDEWRASEPIADFVKEDITKELKNATRPHKVK